MGRGGRRLDQATALRRWMGHEHAFGGRAINAGVLVMDLDCMREDDFTARYLALGERFGLHDQDTMLMYLGRTGFTCGRWNTMWSRGVEAGTGELGSVGESEVKEVGGWGEGGRRAQPSG